MRWLKNNWIFLAAGVVLSVYLVVDGPGSSQEVQPPVQLKNPDEEVPVLASEKENNDFVFVDLKGEVSAPGIYRMKTEQRVDDLLKVAGGLTETADLSQVNRAQRLIDEMVVYIPAKGEGDIAAPATVSAPSGQPKIHINTATLEQMTTLNGIGTKKAEAILAYREENGPFTSLDDLVQVSGIGEKTVENIQEMIQVP